MDDPRAAVHSLTRRAKDKTVFGQPVKAVPGYIAKSMRPEEAFRATLSDCLAQITANAATLRLGRSVEGLHQLRVAFRRLEVALGPLAGNSARTGSRNCAAAPRSCSGRLSPARDLDVFTGKLLASPAQVRRQRRRCRSCARAPKPRATRPGWRPMTASPAPISNFSPTMSRRLAGSQLASDPRPQAAAHGQAHAGPPGPAREKARPRRAKAGRKRDLHRLRIALKKLRYTAEFFAPLYPRREVDRYLQGSARLAESSGRPQ